MHFDLTDLRLFVAVAEARNLTHASRAQRLAVGAASARIRSLEDTVGARLFIREAKGVRLTPAGEAMLHHARRMLEQTERMRVDLAEYGRGLRGRIRLFGVMTAVAEHAADVGIVSSGVALEGLQSFPFRSTRLVIAAPADHPIAARESVRFEQTLEHDYVNLIDTASLGGFLSEIFATLGRAPHVRAQVRAFDDLCQFAAAGVGLAVVPDVAAARFMRNSDRLRTVAIEDDWALREMRVCVRDLEALPQIARELVEHLREAV